MMINITVTFTMLAIIAFANPGMGQAQTKERAKLIEDAKKEGKVMVYVSSNASDARALEAAFEKKYPFVNMEFYSSGKDALLTRYLLEARTGSNLADVYQSSVFPIMNLAEKGLLAKYYSPEREGYIEALRDIEPGEELGYEYGLTWETFDDPDELANYACRCGALECRGTMLDPVPLDKKRKRKSRKSTGRKKARR